VEELFEAVFNLHIPFSFVHRSVFHLSLLNSIDKKNS